MNLITKAMLPALAVAASLLSLSSGAPVEEGDCEQIVTCVVAEVVDPQLSVVGPRDDGRCRCINGSEICWTKSCNIDCTVSFLLPLNSSGYTANPNLACIDGPRVLPAAMKNNICGKGCGPTTFFVFVGNGCNGTPTLTMGAVMSCTESTCSDGVCP